MASDEKKYQVFVSSTFEDLRGERSEVIQALLELDCIPSGMELFPAADDDQWSLIKGVIDDCDYYVVIIGGRYGTRGPQGFSYTEMEYRYAVEQGKPVLAFVHSDPGSIPALKSEQDPDGKKLLGEFRELAKKKMIRGWTSAHELGAVVSRSMVSLKKSHPAIGWVRGDHVSSSEAVSENLRLRQTIDELRVQLNKASTEAPIQAKGLANGEEQFEFNVTFQTLEADGSRTDNTWLTQMLLKWDELFMAAGPTLLGEASSYQLHARLNRAAGARIGEQIDVDAESSLKGRTIQTNSVTIQDEDFETILVQFLALGYITMSERHRTVKDRQDYWTLTPYGATVTNRLRAIRSASPEL